MNNPVSRRITLLAGLLVILGACTSSVDDAAADAASQLADDIAPSEIEQALELSPRTASAGDLISVDFPDVAGGWFSFAMWTGTEWQPTVNALIVQENGGGIVPLDEEVVLGDEGLIGPVTVAIPDDVAPGTYRLCAGADFSAQCGTIEVTS